MSRLELNYATRFLAFIGRKVVTNVFCGLDCQLIVQFVRLVDCHILCLSGVRFVFTNKIGVDAEQVSKASACRARGRDFVPSCLNSEVRRVWALRLEPSLWPPPRRSLSPRRAV